MNISKAEKSRKELLINKSYTYLCDNFHKFDKRNRIKIALAIVTKDMPTELIGDGLKQNVIIQIIKPLANSSDSSIGISGIRTSVAEASKSIK